MQETYNIYFSGDIADGESLEDVRRRVGALFNAREPTLDKLFSGRTQLIKRNCSHDEALKYQTAMQRAGALATIAPTEASAGSADRTGNNTVTQSSSAGAAAGSRQRDAATLALAPAGTEVLLPAERHTHSPRAVDLSAYSVAPAGERLAAPAPAAPPAPDTSHISAMEIGDALPALAAAEPPPPPDTSAFSLAEPAAGLLEARHRQGDAPATPATDHLSVEPLDND